MAARYEVKIDDEVRVILGSDVKCVGVNASVEIPLDRPTYERVDKVLRALGGKWNRSLRCHVFPSDARALIDNALGAGKAVDAAKLNQQFFTPAAVAGEIMRALDPEPGLLALEPSAGDGALAIPMLDAGMLVHAVDQDGQVVQRCLMRVREAGYALGEIVCHVGNFLVWEPVIGTLYDRVAMNPPFAKGAACRHLIRALRLLAPGGVLVSILPNGPGWAAGRDGDAFLDLTRGWAVESVPLADDAFATTGTMVRTRMLVVRRPG